MLDIARLSLGLFMKRRVGLDTHLKFSDHFWMRYFSRRLETSDSTGSEEDNQAHALLSLPDQFGILDDVADRILHRLLHCGLNSILKVLGF